MGACEKLGSYGLDEGQGDFSLAKTFLRHYEIDACVRTIYARETLNQFSAAISSSKSYHATQSATYATIMCSNMLRLLKSSTADTT